MTISPAEFPALISQPLAPPAGQFITRVALTPSAPLIACAAFDLQAFTPDLFATLRIPCPPAILRAARKRQAEYLASRWLVREIAALCDVPEFILTNDDDRAPCWPSAFTASLSHTAGLIFVLADTDKRIAGIDVEHWMSQEVAEESSSILMDDTERQLIDSLSMPRAQATTLLFSLKESLYKALWPEVRQYIDFLQVRLLALDEQQQTATLQLEETLSAGYSRGARFQARFTLTSQCVFTWINQ
ncbi:4'-phosphopantetheinyl transferase family protein [Tatumella citrea]|uniref:Enterobactin synthase component D n=1 Tax=Tatumella citrea TaxID=53336 RepID=A0A1Y0LEK4_TATCI|nr:4'-phosphopantetheinyl transferase superfamily protein [Tatumella citrea]ARU96205.1 hypothetical protein A7K98_13515 [Tatumella citrea]ARU98722.1 hypothetical protein A7K99_13500 [Tatumella citrea]